MFTVYKLEVGVQTPIQYLPGTEGETFVLGEALSVSAGALTKCAADAKPEYIAVGAANGLGEVPVVAVDDHVQFMAHLSEAGAELKLGDKVTISADGLCVTATTGGKAKILAVHDSEIGGKAIVKFVD